MRGALISLVLMAAVNAVGAGALGEPFALTDSLGTEIDAAERDRYGLFPDAAGFVAAHLTRTRKGSFRLQYTLQETSGLRTRTVAVSPSVVEHTRVHARLVERYWAAGAELPWVDRAVLVLASRGEYDAASRLIEATLSREAQSPGLLELLESAKTLSGARGLYSPGSFYDHSGRTELLIFSGYYGLWLGVATPIIAKAGSGEAYGLSLLVIPPASLWVTSRATRHAGISDGRAGMISLGGHLGTWQGLGWASLGDKPGRQVIAAGTAAGLAGIGAATVLTRTADLTPGHAEIAGSGLTWGAWLGAVVGMLADHHDDGGVLRDMLIGSDIAVSAGLLAGRGSPVSRARVRVCNMAGVLGGIAGLGIALIARVNDEDPAVALAAAGSLAGLYAGIATTRQMDKKEHGTHASLSSGAQKPERAVFAPRVGIHASPTSRRPAPALEVGVRF